MCERKPTRKKVSRLKAASDTDIVVKDMDQWMVEREQHEVGEDVDNESERIFLQPDSVGVAVVSDALDEDDQHDRCEE